MFTKLVSLRWAWNSASNWLIFYVVDPMKPEEIYEVWKFSTLIQVCCPNMIGQFQTFKLSTKLLAHHIMTKTLSITSQHCVSNLITLMITTIYTVAFSAFYLQSTSCSDCYTGSCWRYQHVIAQFRLNLAYRDYWPWRFSIFYQMLCNFLFRLWSRKWPSIWL